jgi:hypothetical protein
VSVARRDHLFTQHPLQTHRDDGVATGPSRVAVFPEKRAEATLPDESGAVAFDLVARLGERLLHRRQTAQRPLVHGSQLPALLAQRLAAHELELEEDVEGLPVAALRTDEQAEIGRPMVASAAA